MQKKTYKIKEYQYFSDVIKLIPSNVIIEKPTGFGVTHKALIEPRSTIVIEPNRPVIKGKTAKFNKGNTRKLVLRAVYEDITVSDIISYLQSGVEHKKIMTTPESYPKVVDAFRELDLLDEMYKTYFLLYDECEKTVQDIDYRDSIIKPMEDFFKFKNKAYVSATPIFPSDPRFTLQKFRHLVFEPDYNCKQDCNLIVTNNTLYSFKKYIETSKNDRYFIFLNSTKAIVTFMNYLGIKDDTLIFCSEESKNKLKLNKHTNASESLVGSEDYKKYNFFTSRFNSAVDIEGIIKPNVVIITDTYLAEHTMADPFSEVQQIVGRFRKPQGGQIERYLTHITNVSPDLVSTSRDQIMLEIEVFKKLHKVLKDFSDSATSAFSKSVVDEMLERSEFAKFVNKADGSINHYMVDNAIFNNAVNNYYRCPENLIEAYNQTKMFNLTIDQQSYELTDEHKASLKEANNLKSSLELLLPILNNLYQQGLDDIDVQLQLKQIEKEHPTAYRTFKVLGFERADELKYSYRSIIEEVKRVESKTQHEHFGFLTYLQDNFTVGESYTFQGIRSKLKRGIEKFNLDRLKPTKELFETYFKVTPRTYDSTIKGKKVYKYLIISYKFKFRKH